MALTQNSKETLALSGAGGLLLLLNSWPAFKYYFFSESFTYLRIYNLHNQRLWESAFSLQDSMFFRPGFLLASIWWHFVLPPEPVYYHIRNFAFCILSIVLLHRVLLRLVRSRPARIIALLLFASSKMFMSIIGYTVLSEVSILLITTLLTLLFWLRYIEKRRTVDYLLALVFCFACSYSKEIGFSVIVPMAILVLVVAMKPGDFKGQIRYWVIRYSPAVAIAVSYLTLRYILTGPIPPGNAVYSPQLTFAGAWLQARGFLATVGNFTLTTSGTMGTPGLSSLFPRGSTRIETILCVAFWALVLFTLWRGRGARRLLILPLAWIALYLLPTFLIRNHQVYYYQESLVGVVLLVGICLDRIRPRLVTVWYVVVFLVAMNGFISNQRSYYYWQYTANFVGQLKPSFEEWRSNPPESVTYVCPPNLFELGNWALANPLTQQLTGHWIPVSVIKSGGVIPPGTLEVELNDEFGPPVIRKWTSATGSLTADPNPIRVCDGSELGATTISWTFEGAKKVEIHVDRPDGDLFASADRAGYWQTARWVYQGRSFYLQDVTNGRPLGPENTIARLTIDVTNAGCR